MSTEVSNVALSILGREIVIKCPKDKIAQLQESAHRLEVEMRKAHEHNKLMSIDKIAIITAINFIHQLLYTKTVDPDVPKRINSLCEKIGNELAQVN